MGSVTGFRVVAARPESVPKWLGRYSESTMRLEDGVPVAWELWCKHSETQGKCARICECPERLVTSTARLREGAQMAAEEQCKHSEARQRCAGGRKLSGQSAKWLGTAHWWERLT